MRNRGIVWTKFGLAFLMLVAAFPAARSESVIAQASDPSTLPLLSSASLQYLGGFRVPANSANGDTYAAGGFAVAFNPVGNSLFVSSYYGNVAEISIPVPAISSDPEALPIASFLQPFADPTEGRVNEATFGYGGGISSLLVYNNRLYGTAQIYYDSNNEQRVSHYSRSLRLDERSFSGWASVWRADKTGYVSGFMAAIPSAWQAKLGGQVATGQCCIPIVSRTSFGPSAFAFDPNALAGGTTASASPLLYYDGAHQTLGEYTNMTTANPTYNQSIEIHGFVMVEGTRTALYIGRNGTGVPCYGNGTSNQSLVGTYGPDGAMWCYDLDQFGKGTHAWPYRYQVWAYDLNEFAAVKAGTKQPWEVVPYGVWPLNLPTPGNEVRLGGASYDRATQTLYISQRLADIGGQSYRPIIHAFHLDAATPEATPNPPAATVNSVAMASDKTAPQAAGTAITFTAQPAGGVAPYQYKWLISDGVTSTVAANWTTANRFTWTPAAANPNYRVSVWVRSAGNTVDAFEASTSLPFAVAAQSLAAASTTSVSLVANRPSPQPAFTAITWSATPVGGAAPHQYKWLVSDGTVTTVAANWSTTNSFTWTPSTANANYRVTVWVRSAGAAGDQAEASANSPFAITAATTAPPQTTTAPKPSSRVSHVTLSSSKPSPLSAGTTAIITAQAFGGTAPYQYQWSVFDGKVWKVTARWSAANTFSWTPTTSDPKYQVSVWARSAGSTNERGEATISMPFVVNNGNGK